MAKAKKGDRVKINFTGTLDDGTVFASTLDLEDCSAGDCESDDCGCDQGPLELVIGEGEFVPQIEEALVGMACGEKKTLNIPSADAFGDYDDEMVFVVPRAELPADLHPEVGQELELTGDDDEDIEVTVIEVTEESITLDANHPLAGEDLTYEIELLEIL